MSLLSGEITNERNLEASGVADLLVGPLLRYVGTETATVWVETTKPCEVGVLGHRTRTFHVEGHHYALLVVKGLEPGATTPYELMLDDVVVWPRADEERPPRPRSRSPATSAAVTEPRPRLRSWNASTSATQS